MTFSLFFNEENLSSVIKTSVTVSWSLDYVMLHYYTTIIAKLCTDLAMTFFFEDILHYTLYSLWHTVQMVYTIV